MTSITREQVKQALDKGVTLVDARDPEDYEQGHLPNAISIPAADVQSDAPQLLQSKNEKIITYCGGGACPKSQEAADALRELGYTNVSEYSGGMQEWQGAGGQIDKGAANNSGSAGNTWAAA